jgi:hypothetical protein
MVEHWCSAIQIEKHNLLNILEELSYLFWDLQNTHPQWKTTHGLPQAEGKVKCARYLRLLG